MESTAVLLTGSALLLLGVFLWHLIRERRTASSSGGVVADEVAKDRDLPFKLVVESAPNGLLMVGQDGIISMANAQIVRMFGYSREELLGRPAESLILVGDRSILKEAQTDAWSASAARPMGMGIELRGLRKDGSEFPVEIGLNPVSIPSGAALLAAVTDITARRRAERWLRDSEERLELAVRAAQIGIFEHDHRTDLLYWSPTLRSIYGVSAGEPSSLQRYVELIHHSDRDRILSAIKESQDSANDGQFHVEHRIVRPDGEVRHISLHSLAWFEREENAARPRRTIGIVIDITDRKRAEATLHGASKMAAISTLSSGIAHEFNNSLTAVLGFSHLALPLISEDNKAHRYIQQVMSAGLEARELVQQLLTFSRTSDHVRHPLPLHLLVKEALKCLRPSIPSSIELKEEIDTSTSLVLADTTQMHQMIINLADNAIYAMRKTGGILEFHLQDEEIESDQVAPSGQLAPGLYVRLTVRDSGEGMAPEVADRIFEPFFTAKPLGEGRGMGLSIVHGIVTTHGGTILVDSQIDVGTAVSVYIPAAPRPATAVPSSPEQPTHGQERPPLLLVEESDALRSRR